MLIRRRSWSRPRGAAAPRPHRPRAGLSVPSVAVAAVAATLVAVGGLATPAGAIANGEPVPEGRYRFSVKLTMTGITRPDGTRYDSACSGALIARRWIVSAGHCFHDGNRVRVSGPPRYAVTATVGRVEAAGSGGHDLQVVEVRQSPVNDLAVARLARPVTDVRPLRLATRAPGVGEVLRLTGWGALDPATATPATHLRTGQFAVVSVATDTVGVIGEAPAPNTSACVYDSGGPYFRERHGRPELVSVESTGPTCPHALEETTARVDQIADWITEQTRG